MITNAAVIYFLATMVIVGVIIAMFYKVYLAVEELESKLSGIWSNHGDTMRILIYNLNSSVRGEVIWNKSGNDRILGVTIIENIHVAFFGWSRGTYIDPVTRNQFKFQLKLKDTNLLRLRVFEKRGQLKREEDWKLVG